MTAGFLHVPALHPPLLHHLYCCHSPEGPVQDEEEEVDEENPRRLIGER